MFSLSSNKSAAADIDDGLGFIKAAAGQVQLVTGANLAGLLANQVQHIGYPDLPDAVDVSDSALGEHLTVMRLNNTLNLL